MSGISSTVANATAVSAPSNSNQQQPQESESKLQAEISPVNQKQWQFKAERVIGNGAFGVVYQATVVETGETVAIKKVLLDPRFKNRELQIMTMIDHTNVVSLKHHFHSKGDKEDEVYLNLVMDYVPTTIQRTLRTYTKSNKLIPLMQTKVYMYQLARGLAYLHSLHICHRDIQPSNLLIDPTTLHLKLGDFGSAKFIRSREKSVSYVCGRYYRPPEMIFENAYYTQAIDLWCGGCVFAEMLLGKAIFPGQTGVDQLIEIIKVLGSPSADTLKILNSNSTKPLNLPVIKPIAWTKVFAPCHAPANAIDLVSKWLRYEPNLRLDAFESLAHPFFDELRQPGAQMPNGQPVPESLFQFTDNELKLMQSRDLTNKLIPNHIIKNYNLIGV